MPAPPREGKSNWARAVIDANIIEAVGFPRFARDKKDRRSRGRLRSTSFIYSAPLSGSTISQGRLRSKYQLPITNYQEPTTKYQKPHYPLA